MNKKITISDVVYIRKTMTNITGKRKREEKMVDLAREFDVTAIYIGKIVSGVVYKDVVVKPPFTSWYSPY